MDALETMPDKYTNLQQEKREILTLWLKLRNNSASYFISFKIKDIYVNTGTISLLAHRYLRTIVKNKCSAHTANRTMVNPPVSLYLRAKE